MFYTEPQGRHHVYVCTNLSCSPARRPRTLLKELEAHLGIRSASTTPDGSITLGHEECLGSCGTAPVMLRRRPLPREPRRGPGEARSSTRAGVDVLTAPFVTGYLSEHYADDDASVRSTATRRSAASPASEAGARDGARRGRPRRSRRRDCAVAAVRASSPGLKWTFMPDGERPAQGAGLQRRRVRARLVQGPADHGARAAAGARGGLLIAAWATGARLHVHLRARRVRARDRACSKPRSRECYAQGLSGREHPREEGLRRTTSSCTAARARTSAAKRPGCSSRSRARRASRARSRRSRRSTARSACRRR